MTKLKIRFMIIVLKVLREICYDHPRMRRGNIAIELRQLITDLQEEEMSICEEEDEFAEIEVKRA